MQRTSALRRGLPALVVAMLSVVGVLGLAAPTASASGNGPGVRVKTHGCPAYTVCVYPRGTGWNGDRPQSSCAFPTNYDVLVDHRWCNFHAMVGTHKVFNNGLHLCTSRNGRPWIYDESAQLDRGSNGADGSDVWIDSGGSIDVDLTPYNSMTLWYVHGERTYPCP